MRLTIIPLILVLIFCGPALATTSLVEVTPGILLGTFDPVQTAGTLNSDLMKAIQQARLTWKVEGFVAITDTGPVFQGTLLSDVFEMPKYVILFVQPKPSAPSP